jgi:hypothetical protein
MPRRQYSHLPQDEMQEIRTRSPGLKVVTAAPTDDAHALMTQYPAGGAGGDVALEDVQIGAADDGLDHPDDGVARVLDHGHGPVFERLLARSLVNKRLHGAALSRSMVIRPREAAG